eukprot:Nitzschia sp. Nitz4//scaffold215_size37433//14497//15588//NITZ4_007750-RA/size37433-processed-gene-0.41-mRNA-1//1//CDS//3329542148//8013//frame0
MTLDIRRGEGSETVYFFGYGPIVNPTVRRRRGVETDGEEAAILPDFRLTFAYGGVVNLVKRRGYEVQGVLMRFDDPEQWKRFRSFDAGYDLDEVLVYPFKTPEYPIRAYSLIMKNFDEGKSDETTEKLPQERYLRLIAEGMRRYKIDEEYIEDHVFSVPYIPKTSPENFKSFPAATNPLPKITFQHYRDRLCRFACDWEVYFILGNRVIHLGDHDPENPCAIWYRSKAHGLPDVTLTLHQMIVDPDIPMVDSRDELTPLHVAWAENHTWEYLEQGGITARVVFEIEGPQDLEAMPKSPPSLTPVKRRPSLFSCCSGADVEASVENPMLGPDGKPLKNNLRKGARAKEKSTEQESDIDDYSFSS